MAEKRGALKDALTLRAISGLRIPAENSCLRATPASPNGADILLLWVFFPFFLHTPPEHRHAAPFPSRVSLPFSPQSNYLASEGGNLLSLVAAQVPIRGNTLHLSNELIALNELKTLLRREKKRGGAAGRDEGDLGDEFGNVWERRRKRGGVAPRSRTLALMFWCFLLDLLPTLFFIFFVKFKHASWKISHEAEWALPLPFLFLLLKVAAPRLHILH